MNPFDLKAALLAKHAQHPVIIHFPIALFIASLAFDFLAIWRRNPALATVAYYNLLAAAVMTPMAIASGLTAWQWQRRATQGQSSPASDLRTVGERNDLGALRVARSTTRNSETASGKALLCLGARDVCADRARRPFGRHSQRR
jgi:Predicted membrane protein (DUF2231)